MAWRSGCSRIGRLIRLGVAALVPAAVIAACAPAEAHHYRHLHRYGHVHYAHYARIAHYPRYAHRSRGWQGYRPQTAAALPSSPAFSAIVVDANSGRTLYAAAENGL
jgi:D-alanyl-D-alanine carboxypeptidase